MTPEEFQKGSNISVFKDPFSLDCIDSVAINMLRRVFTKKPYWYGCITFKNGLTNGEQRTPDCDSYDEVMVHMGTIMESLKSK